MTLRKLCIILLMTPVFFAFTLGVPDIFVKVYIDDLKENRKAIVGVFSKKNKDLSDKYSIEEYEAVLLNTQGKVKWKKKFTDTEINIIDEDIRLMSGDLLVIRDIFLLEKKSGKKLFIEDITERYLIR